MPVFTVALSVVAQEDTRKAAFVAEIESDVSGEYEPPEQTGRIQALCRAVVPTAAEAVSWGGSEGEKSTVREKEGHGQRSRTYRNSSSSSNNNGSSSGSSSEHAFHMLQSDKASAAAARSKLVWLWLWWALGAVLQAVRVGSVVSRYLQGAGEDTAATALFLGVDSALLALQAVLVAAGVVARSDLGRWERRFLRLSIQGKLRAPFVLHIGEGVLLIARNRSIITAPFTVQVHACWCARETSLRCSPGPARLTMPRALHRDCSLLG